MVKVTVTVHPKGLGPKEAAKAWYLRTQQKQQWSRTPALTQNACLIANGRKACDSVDGPDHQGWMSPPAFISSKDHFQIVIGSCELQCQ